MAELPDASVLAAAVVVLALVAAGPGWSTAADLGEGTADVRVVEPDWLPPGSGPADRTLRAEPGRFGTEAWYLRSPTLVADVSNVSGDPELYYDVSVPELGAEPAAVSRQLTGPGRYRLAPDDAALPPAGYDGDDADLPADGTYTGRLEVRVRSFSGQRVIANRTVEVIVDR